MTFGLAADAKARTVARELEIISDPMTVLLRSKS